MEDQVSDGESDGWMEGFVAALNENQSHARQVRQDFRGQSQDFQETLDHQFREISGAVAVAGQEYDQRSADLQRREQQLDDRELCVKVQIAQLDQLKNDLAEQRVEWLRLQAESVDLQQSLLDEIRQQHDQLNECRRQLAAERLELDRREESCTQRIQRGSEPENTRDELAQLRQERQHLQDRLAKAESQTNASAATHPDAAEFEALRHRLHQALTDLGHLKSSHEQLEQQLSAAQETKSSGSAGAPADNDRSWEAQKRRMLAQLESDHGSDAPLARVERLKIGEVIRATDRMVKEKQQEVDKLQKRLQEQASQIGDAAVGPAAIDEILDQSELIRQERERLRSIQQEWHAKLRKAEIEISTERAKLAREKVKQDEKALAYERASQHDIAPTPEDETRTSGPRRWLARLGFIESGE